MGTELKGISGIDTAVAQIVSGLGAKKEEIEHRLSVIKSIVITADAGEDEIRAWSNDRTAINKERKAFDDERKVLKNGWAGKLLPIMDAYKEIDTMYAETIAHIDTELDNYDERRRTERTKAIRAAYLGNVPEDMQDALSLERILSMRDPAVKTVKTYSETWYNKTCKIEQVIEIIRGLAQDCDMAVNTIKGMRSKFEPEGLRVFWETLSMNDAISEMSRRQREADEYEAKMKAERERQIREAEEKARREAEAKAYLEEQRIRREEERKRQEAIEAARAEERRLALERAEEERKQREADEQARKQKEEAELAARWAAVHEAESSTEKVINLDSIPKPHTEPAPAPSFSFDFSFEKPKVIFNKLMVSVPDQELKAFLEYADAHGITYEFV